MDVTLFIMSLFLFPALSQAACPTETFGPNCTFPCNPSCANPINQSETSCDRFNGTCLYGCDIGYEGPECHQPCATDTFGPNCMFPCNPSCANSINQSETSCDRFNGTCLYGCDIGYMGSECRQRCVRGWFGSRCQFKCRCTNVSCDTKGLCTTGKRCLAGWFGPACQYEDIAYNRSNSTEATDEDDETCVDSVTVRRIFISLIYPLKWIRVNFKIAGVLDKFKVNMWGTNGTKMCHVSRNASVDNRTMDIHCLRTSFIYTIVVYGVGAQYVCSVYVTGGRNVAMKQRVNQSSTYIERTAIPGYKDWTFPAELAVDGDRNQNLYVGNRCAMTNNESMRPGALSVWLSPPCVVNKYYVYNRLDDRTYRLRGFILESYNASGDQVYRRQDQKSYDTRVYDVQHGDKVVSRVSIISSNVENVLHVCELEIYGEYLCPPRRFGLECEKTCNCIFNDDCFISTGGCPSGCDNGYFGGDCTTPCAAETFGPSCMFPCSPLCDKSISESKTSCYRSNGTCVYGCAIGYGGSSCNVPCGLDTYGINCQLSCNEHCLPSNDSNNSSCDHITGACSNGCASGYNGTFCEDICGLDTYGIHCQLSCKEHCLPSNDSSISSCDHITGACSVGCASGYSGKFCEDTCDLNTFGTNCQMNCSNVCLPAANSSMSTCHYVTGVCVNGCADGYNGKFCITWNAQASDTHGTMNWIIIVAVSIISAVATLIAIMVALFCIVKKKDVEPEEDSE